MVSLISPRKGLLDIWHCRNSLRLWGCKETRRRQCNGNWDWRTPRASCCFLEVVRWTPLHTNAKTRRGGGASFVPIGMPIGCWNTKSPLQTCQTHMSIRISSQIRSFESIYGWQSSSVFVFRFRIMFYKISLETVRSLNRSPEYRSITVCLHKHCLEKRIQL